MVLSKIYLLRKIQGNVQVYPQVYSARLPHCLVAWAAGLPRNLYKASPVWYPSPVASRILRGSEESPMQYMSGTLPSKALYKRSFDL